MPAVFAPMGQSPQICTVCQCINQFNQFICVSFFCFCFISFYFNPTWRTLDISSPNFVYRQTNKQTNTRSCLYSCSTTKKGPAGLKPVRDIVPEFMNWCWVIQHLPITWVIKYNIDLNHLFTNKRDFNNSLPFIKILPYLLLVIILCGSWSTLCGSYLVW